ncbi:FtsW/RodA/SpoVE family cell cycle protein [Sneathia sanguinegens]|uniref:FtsW/RodA/SpoVE family cell cycle protein n=1 Tax=Sneathia sanguinegens TaxID=40543 RepID=UPI000833EE39|nr:FtsW/RodA/SpoVE family cell cycle protein [Sneathia sanguinegens]
MNDIEKRKRKILICLFLLTLIGLIFVGSLSQPDAEYNSGNKLKYFYAYIAYIVIGVGMGSITYVFNFIVEIVVKNKFKRIIISGLFGVIIVGLSIWVLWKGVSINGATRWIRIGSFTIQPSELMKPLVIYIFATLFSETKLLIDWGIITFKEETKLLIGWGIITFFVVGIVVLQKSKTSAIQLALISYLMLCICSKVKEIKKFIFGAVGLFGGIIGIMIIKDYSTNRLNNFLNGSSVQVNAAILAIKSGGIFGRGIGNGLQKYFYLPEAHNDYVFASICEEGGLIFAALIIIIFVVLIFNMLVIAFKMKESFNKYLIYGVIFSILNQAILNIGINLNCLPSTGITLPFISYGGSSYVSNMICMGLLFSAINIAQAKKGMYQ